MILHYKHDKENLKPNEILDDFFTVEVQGLKNRLYAKATYFDADCTDLQCEEGLKRSFWDLCSVLAGFGFTPRQSAELIVNNDKLSPMYCTDLGKIVFRYRTEKQIIIDVDNPHKDGLSYNDIIAISKGMPTKIYLKNAPDDKNISYDDFLNILFNYQSSGIYYSCDTFFDKECLHMQARHSARRTIKDLISIFQTFYEKEFTVEDIVKILIQHGYIQGFRCPDIKRLVFYRKSGSVDSILREIERSSTFADDYTAVFISKLEEKIKSNG